MKIAFAVAVAVAAGICAFAMAAGLSGSILAAWLIGAVAGGIAGWAAWTRLAGDLDAAATSPGLRVLSGVAAVIAIGQLARMAVFMVAPTAVGYSMVPGSAWEVRHSCLTAYFVAGEAAGRGQDIYAAALYDASSSPGSSPRKQPMMGPFGIDVYEYPPPFLLLPRACRLLTGDFLRLRAFWFGLSAGTFLFAMLVVARLLGPTAGTRALLLLPLAFAGFPVISTLQKGNAQLVVVALAMLAMVLFERRRFALGGTLLAYAIGGKLWPGLLGVYLLARRQWRAAGWTAAMGLVLVALTVLDVGLDSFRAFLHHLPGLLSGEAFPALRNPGPIAINLSIPGLVFKAGLFGVPGTGFGPSRIVGWIFTVVILWATARAAQRPLAEAEKPLVWMALLIVATLRSPFLPYDYGNIPPLWVLTLLVATYFPTARTLSFALLGWLALNLYWPLDAPMEPRLRATLSLLPQAATIALAVLALRRRVGPEPSTL